MINGIAELHYGVSDIPESINYFDDFGLPLIEQREEFGYFRLPNQSSVYIRHRDDPVLPAGRIRGDGVREVVWAVDSQEALHQLVRRISAVVEVVSDDAGVVHFVPPFGIPMALAVTQPRPVQSAPDPLNSPGKINRLNQHRKWRERALPKLINHVVWALPDFAVAHEFMTDVLNFRLTDFQRDFGVYLRADGSNNHHSILMVNANAPFPGMDGEVRFHHANFGVEDIDEIMIGANYMVRRGWEPSHLGLGRHRIDSGLFYYMPCPAGGEAEYGADADYVDDSWVPRLFEAPLFGFAHYVHNLPPFLQEPPEWNFKYMTKIAGAAPGTTVDVYA